MKYFKKLLGDRIYLSPRSIEDSVKINNMCNFFFVNFLKLLAFILLIW